MSYIDTTRAHQLKLLNGCAPTGQKILHILALADERMTCDQLLFCMNVLNWRERDGSEFTEARLEEALKALPRDLADDSRSFLSREVGAELRYNTTEVVLTHAWQEKTLPDLLQLESQFHKCGVPNRKNYARRGAKEIRRMRLLIFANDGEALNQALLKELNTENGYGLTTRFVESFFMDPSEPWFKSLQPTIRIHLLYPYVSSELIRSKPLYGDLPMLESILAEGVPETHISRCIVAEFLVLQGRFQEAEAIIKAVPVSWAEALRGWITLLRGDYKPALATMDKALKMMRKETKKSKVYLRPPAGFFHIPLLANSNDPDNIKAAIRMAQADSGSHINDGRIELGNMIEARTDASKVHGFQGRVTSNSHLLTTLLRYLATYWVDPQITARSLPGLIELEAVARQTSFRWIALTAADLIGRVGGTEEYSSRSQEGHAALNAVPLAELLPISEPWLRALEALQSLVSVKNNPDSSQSDIRVVWCISMVMREWQFRPMEQKLLSRGWSKPKSIPQHLVADKSPLLTYLSPQDWEICATMLPKSITRISARKGSYLFDIPSALRAMVGHPHLYLDGRADERVVLAKMEPELRVVQEGKTMTMAMYPERIHFGENAYTLIKEGSARLGFYQMTPELERIYDVLGPGLIIPNNGRDDVMKTIHDLSSCVVVNAVLPQMTTGNTGVSNSRIHVQLVPRNEGLKLSVAVRPFGAEGPYFQPGEGGETVFTHIEGERRSVRRNLKGERQALRDTFSACPTWESADENSGEWQFIEPETCLALLTELKGVKDLLLTWPEGETMRVSAASTSSMSLRIRGKNEWFELSGELTIDEGDIVDMVRLLKLMDNNQGRYIPLGEGRFLALTHGFRQRLDELRALTDNGNISQIHTLHAPTLTTLVAEVGKLDADESWQNAQTRMADALALEPLVPSTFQADLRGYQEEGFVWLSRLANWGVGACLADDMGLG